LQPSPGLIIFDCDGVLVDSEILSAQAVCRQLQRHGIDIDMAEAIRRFLGRSLAEIARYYEAVLGCQMPENFGTELWRDLQEMFKAKLCAMPHVPELLQRLDIPFCLASSSNPERISFSLAQAGLQHHFDGRIFSATMVARGKPAPDLFLLAAERMAADPANCLVVEDSVSGVTAGRDAGMRVWGFVGGSHHAERAGATELRDAGAEQVFSHMAELDAALKVMGRRSGTAM
jgi:HAD superfamily hydrolase (TIGR01509 family)